jgi:hypothetical protein
MLKHQLMDVIGERMESFKTEVKTPKNNQMSFIKVKLLVSEFF